MLWEDGQVQYCRFLACSGKMVRPAMEDCWLVPGRWSGSIRQLWRISGLLQDDGQAPSDGCGGFLACSRTMVRSCTVDFGVLWAGPVL